jgi:FkbM family methyltransferase
MNPFKALSKDIKGLRRLGLGFLVRHPKAWLGSDLARVSVKNFGRVWLRYSDSDAAVAHQVFAGREYDLKRFAQFARVDAAYRAALSAGRRPVIVDAGANIGLTAMWFARAFPEALVTAIEPDPRNLEVARRNLAGFTNIELVDAAIGADPGIVRLVGEAGKGFSTRTVRESSGAGVRVITIAEAKAMAGPQAELLIVKADIEGFEADLFASNLDWLDEVEVVFVEVHDWMLPGQHTSRSLQKAMFAREFELLIRGENLIFVRA